MNLIERQWELYAKAVLAKDAPEIQLRECKLAFFAGAQALFASIMTLLDPGEEPTDSDLRKIDEIDRELKTFVGQVTAGANRGSN